MSRVISISEVNKHRDKNSVWMIIHNDVYDVTKFLDEHPGGEEALLDFAGKEATQGFEDVGHSEDARELLKKFKIGTLPLDEREKDAPQTIVTPTCCPRIDELMNINDDDKSWRDFDGAKASTPQAPENGSNLKWYILALLGAIALGVLIKKKMGA